MWPFDEPGKQIPIDRSLPKIGFEPQGDPKDLKIQELEQRLFGLELAIIEVCQALKHHQDTCNGNFMMMEDSFNHLVNYVVTSRVSIMGEQKEKN